MNVFIIHGAYGHPKENWFPWLQAELEKKGHKVFVPKFPTPDGQFLENWLMIFHDYRQHIDENTIFVGHSLGPAFLLSVLETLKKPVRASFFIAGFISCLNNPEFDRINRSFFGKQFNWRKIRQNCKEFYVYASDNDPYVPFKKTKQLARKLGKNTRMFRFRKAGHFNKAAGYKKFERLLKDILSMAK
jgi:predicted alpha/beta hydrolase family esterase